MGGGRRVSGVTDDPLYVEANMMLILILHISLIVFYLQHPLAVIQRSANGKTAQRVILSSNVSLPLT